MLAPRFTSYQGTSVTDNSGRLIAHVPNVANAGLEGWHYAGLQLSPVEVKKEKVDVGKLRQCEYRLESSY